MAGRGGGMNLRPEPRAIRGFGWHPCELLLERLTEPGSLHNFNDLNDLRRVCDPDGGRA